MFNYNKSQIASLVACILPFAYGLDIKLINNCGGVLRATGGPFGATHPVSGTLSQSRFTLDRIGAERWRVQQLAMQATVPVGGSSRTMEVLAVPSKLTIISAKHRLKCLDPVAKTACLLSVLMLVLGTFI